MEVDVAAGYRTVQDVDDMIVKIRGAFATVPEPTRVVIVADWSACGLFTPEVSARAVAMLTTANTRIERSGILHRSTQPTSVLQVFRLIREAEATSYRQVFTASTPLCAFLDEVLSPPEQERLRVFLKRR